MTCQNVIGGQKTLVLCHGLTEGALMNKYRLLKQSTIFFFFFALFCSNVFYVVVGLLSSTRTNAYNEYIFYKLIIG
jgi:hypothetical protein